MCHILDYDYSTCPTGVSSADVVIGAGDMSLFETQEGDRYRPNVDCTFNYQMDTASCSQLTFECEEFVLRRGDYVYVTYGDNTKRFAWRNGGNPVRRSYAGDMTVRFTSDGSRQGPGAYCAVWCSREGSAPSTTASPAPTTSSSTPSPTTSTTQAPTTTEAPVPTTTTGSGIVQRLTHMHKSILGTNMTKPYSWCQHLSLPPRRLVAWGKHVLVL